MATSANISNMFSIYITTSAAETKTIANPGTTVNLADYMNFRIINVKCFNDGGTGNLRITNGASDIVAAQATTNGGWKDMVITQANANLTLTQSITIIKSASGGSWGANSRIILECVATDGGDALTVS